MRFGVCAAPEQRALLGGIGFDYMEPGVSVHLQPEQPTEAIMPPLLAAFAGPGPRPEAFNLLLPGDLKVVGPKAEPDRQEMYLETAMTRAGALGGRVVVFGSGGARHVPDAWTREEAGRQVRGFLHQAGQAAARHGLVVAIEPLNRAESNHINSVAEAGALAGGVAHPSVGVLSDLYHVLHDNQSYGETQAALPGLSHVHVAGAGRRAPCQEDKALLRGFFAVLKAGSYEGRISIEATWDNLAAQGAEALGVLHQAWTEA